MILCAVCVLLAASTTGGSTSSDVFRTAVTSVIMPFQKGMSNIGAFLSRGLGANLKLSDVIEENESLRTEVADLREQNARYQLRLQELENCRELLALNEEYPDYEKVGAHIISKNAGNWFSTFKIDKGTHDGILVGMNVIADGGLVGIVTGTETYTSTVSSIIDDGRSVSAMAMISEAPCVITGNALLRQEGTLDVTHVDKDDDIDVASKIVTSNSSSEFLPGILIGYISEITPDKNNLTKTGKLVPVVDFTRLDSVLVITTLKRTEG